MMQKVSGDESTQQPWKEGGLRYVSFTAGGMKPKSASKHKFSKVLPLQALSWACQHCCSSSVGDFRHSVFISPQEMSSWGFHQVPCLVGRASLCLAP